MLKSLQMPFQLIGKFKMKNVYSITLFSFLLLSTGIHAQTQNELLLSEDFNDIQPESLGQKLLQNKYIQLAEGKGKDGSNAIRVSYVGYERGSQRVTLRFPLTRHVTQATLSFDVLFDQDFQWTYGGKLHGLGPKYPVTGGKTRSDHKWSARTTFKKDGYMKAYLYDQNKNVKYGTGTTSAAPVFLKDQWQHVELEMQLNTANKADGVARISIDGKIQSINNNVMFRGRTGKDTEIQQFLFSTFHGGHKPKWTPVDTSGKPTTVHAYFDNFKVIDNIKK